jgi:hypothetical protein
MTRYTSYEIHLEAFGVTPKGHHKVMIVNEGDFIKEKDIL